MPHQVTDCHFPLCCHLSDNLRFRIGNNFQTFEFRYVFRCRVIQLDLTLLVENHRRDACYRLAHRIEPEDGVTPHGFAGFYVHHSTGLELHNLAPAGYSKHAARYTLFVNKFLHCRPCILQLLSREPDGFGCSRRQLNGDQNYRQTKCRRKT